MSTTTSLAFNVLIKEESGLWIAHCLELDIVATADSAETAASDISELIRAQVGYAIAHDNLDHLYHPAPSEVWQRFLACPNRWERRHSFKKARSGPAAALPSMEIIANTCMSGGAVECNA
ncbi:MAG: hypothetical protein WBG50_10085 [Desulfomonilaceae bacterium]